MKLIDLLLLEGDRDVSNDVFDYLPLCVCGPIAMTPAGRAQWQDVLDLPVTEFGHDYAVVSVANEDEKVEEKLARRLQEFLSAQAGYCSLSDYDKWFILL